MESSYDPEVPLWDIYPDELKAGTKIEICISMFITTLFAKAKSWKQS